VSANVKKSVRQGYYAGVLSFDTIAVGDPRAQMMNTVVDF
jgi:hypothetical protein